MERSEVLKEVSKYFKIQELVDKTTYDKHGESSWKFMDTLLLHAILIIKVNLAPDKAMTINNWLWGGKFSQRGLRTNICSIVSKKVKAGILYLSAHLFGKAVDFDIEGMEAEDVRVWIKDNEHLFPFKIRLEHKINKTGKPITWVHIDVIDEEKNTKKVYMFNV